MKDISDIRLILFLKFVETFKMFPFLSANFNIMRNLQNMINCGKI